MNRPDLPAIRHLIRLRRDAGWTIAGPYGERGYRQHVYREPAEPAWTGAKLCVESDRLEYRSRIAPAGSPDGGFSVFPRNSLTVLVRPDTIADVVGWLRLLGLLPAIANERSSSTDIAGPVSDRHMSEVRV